MNNAKIEKGKEKKKKKRGFVGSFHWMSLQRRIEEGEAMDRWCETMSELWLHTFPFRICYAVFNLLQPRLWLLSQQQDEVCVNYKAILILASFRGLFGATATSLLISIIHHFLFSLFINSDWTILTTVPTPNLVQQIFIYFYFNFSKTEF